MKIIKYRTKKTDLKFEAERWKNYSFFQKIDKNKNYLELNSQQKSQWNHISISDREEARGHKKSK